MALCEEQVAAVVVEVGAQVTTHAVQNGVEMDKVTIVLLKVVKVHHMVETQELQEEDGVQVAVHQVTHMVD
jgi:hypothetical protein